MTEQTDGKQERRQWEEEEDQKQDQEQQEQEEAQDKEPRLKIGRIVPEKHEAARARIETETAIEYIKQRFRYLLLDGLHLRPLSAPLLLAAGAGLNDDLNGVEKPLCFLHYEVTQSLAKWKRVQLARYAVHEGDGILTDMIAIRPSETLSPIHSYCVDQWDWEKRIHPVDRTIEYLQLTVKIIYAAIQIVQKEVIARFHAETLLPLPTLPEHLTFLHAEELVRLYPGQSPKMRENLAAERFGAFFLMGIGAKLSNGEAHDGRSPDYDDWSSLPAATDKEKKKFIYPGLNGDLIVWNAELKQAFELSSMGIRVNAEALMRQLKERDCPERAKLVFHKMLLQGKLPDSIGGGIGQSRLCMFLLRKQHIGQVQVGVWPKETHDACEELGIDLM